MLRLVTVEEEFFALKNVCDFSDSANIEFFANGNFLRYFIPFESLEGKRLLKFIFAITQPHKKRIQSHESSKQKVLLLQYSNHRLRVSCQNQETCQFCPSAVSVLLCY